MMMRRTLLATLICLTAQTAMAADARFSDGAGRWVCQPAQPEWPQVLIDYTEDAYRRCDQNTCVTYPLDELTLENSRIHIRFAPHGDFETGDTGGKYREVIVLAGNEIETHGVCSFRGLEDIYDPRP